MKEGNNWLEGQHHKSFHLDVTEVLKESWWNHCLRTTLNPLKRYMYQGFMGDLEFGGALQNLALTWGHTPRYVLKKFDSEPYWTMMASSSRKFDILHIFITYLLLLLCITVELEVGGDIPCLSFLYNPHICICNIIYNVYAYVVYDYAHTHGLSIHMLVCVYPVPFGTEDKQCLSPV